MARGGWLSRVAVVLAILGAAQAQEAPLLTVLPRDEQLRQLELRADLHMIRKRYPEAIDAYQQALRLQPRHPALLNKLGIAYHQLVRLGEAKKQYERATKADPTYAYAWNNLGTIHYAKKSYRRAIRHYRRALELSPAQAAFHSNLGTALFARKQYDQALEEFRLALLLDPEVFQQRSPFGVALKDYSVEDRARFNFMVAKSFAALGYAEQCLLFLRHALEQGWPAIEVQGDPTFAGLRDDARFQALFTEKPPLLPR